MIEGRRQRFCQQCGRFHDIGALRCGHARAPARRLAVLPRMRRRKPLFSRPLQTLTCRCRRAAVPLLAVEFESNKRSCKRKLKRHNERRRSSAAGAAKGKITWQSDSEEVCVTGGGGWGAGSRERGKEHLFLLPLLLPPRQRAPSVNTVPASRPPSGPTRSCPVYLLARSPAGGGGGGGGGGAYNVSSGSEAKVASSLKRRSSSAQPSGRPARRCWHSRTPRQTAPPPATTPAAAWWPAHWPARWPA